MRVDGPRVPPPEDPKKAKTNQPVNPIRSSGAEIKKMSDEEVKGHLAEVKKQNVRQEPASLQEALEYLKNGGDWIEEFCEQIQTQDDQIQKRCFELLSSPAASSDELWALAAKKDYALLQQKIPSGLELYNKLLGKS